MSKQDRQACFGKEFYAIHLALEQSWISLHEYEQCKLIRQQYDEVTFVTPFPNTYCEICDTPEGFTFYIHDDIYLHMCVPCILKRYKK